MKKVSVLYKHNLQEEGYPLFVEKTLEEAIEKVVDFTLKVYGQKVEIVLSLDSNREYIWYNVYSKPVGNMSTLFCRFTFQEA